MDENAAILLCLRHQDSAGFEFLVKKYRREAFFHAVMFLGNQEDAADACQESFTRAFSAMPKLLKLDNFYPWFYRILKNCCLNMLGRKKTRRKYRDTCFKEQNCVSNQSSPAIEFERQEEQQFIWQVLEALSLEFREILVLKYIKGNCYDEIARILDIPRGTVMSRLYYARKAFRETYIQTEKQESR